MARSQNPTLGSLKKNRTEGSHGRTERFYIKFLFAMLLGLFLLIGICWAGHGVYVRWKEKRLVRVAISEMEKNNLRGASLAARSILQTDPASAAGARIIAEVGERTGDRAALDWRRKVAQAVPDSVDDSLALVRCAIRFNEIDTAERALAAVNERGRNSAAYHEAAALLAQAKHQESKAEAEWLEALRFKPNDSSFRLQLGTLRFLEDDSKNRAAGEASLNELRSDPVQRNAATRALINGGLAHREAAYKLLDLARELQADPNATSADRLMYLDFLRQLKHPQFSSYLTELEGKVASNPDQCSQLLSWMSEHNLNLLALDFTKRLPPETLAKWPVPLALADIYSRLGDWRQLENLTKNANWREGEFMRHACLSRALRGQDKSVAADREWAEATREASGQVPSILALIRAAEEWKWEKEMVDLLWNLSKKPEKQVEAVQTLYRYYAKKGDTAGLYRVLVRWAELAPDDLNVKNNLAQVSLLLGADRDQARRIAADLYQKVPSNAAYATTYAYSLLSNGNVGGAAKVMNKLTEEQLHDPTISLYYGICLAAAHDDKARPFLEAGGHAILLPEEKALLDKALASLDFAARHQ